jgi:single-strand DNA-binding protein
MEFLIMALNHSVIMGRLVRDPEVRRTNTGKAVCSFTVACDKPGKDSGASFIDCVAWEKTADFINNFFIKGSPIVVEGRLESRQYEAKDGQKRTVLEVVVSQAHFCGKKENADDGYTGFVKNTPDTPSSNFAVLDGDDSDLPF